MGRQSGRLIEIVVFDLGETLVDETRAWSEQADAAGLTRLTLFGALGAHIERGEHHRDAGSASSAGRSLRATRASLCSRPPCARCRQAQRTEHRLAAERPRREGVDGLLACPGREVIGDDVERRLGSCDGLRRVCAHKWLVTPDV